MNGKFKFYRIYRNMYVNYIGVSVIFNVYNVGNLIKKIYLNVYKILFI